MLTTSIVIASDLCEAIPKLLGDCLLRLSLSTAKNAPRSDTSVLWIIAGVLIVIAYLWGAISPAFIIARVLKGVDLRHYGSGTVGGSNVGEQVGRAWMIMAGFLDLVKGFAPPMLVRAWGLDWGIAVLVSLAIVVGHNWSLYLGFKGGRGMGAAVGILFAWDMRLAILLLVILAIGTLIKQGAPSAAIALVLLAPGAWVIGDASEIVWGSVWLVLVIAIKRLEANRLPLPDDPKEQRAVLLRRLWLDRDIPSDQAWQKRGKIK